MGTDIMVEIFPYAARADLIRATAEPALSVCFKRRSDRISNNNRFVP